MKRIEYRWLRIIHKVDIQIKNHRFYPQSNSKSEQKKIFRFSVLHNNWLRTRRGSEQLHYDYVKKMNFSNITISFMGKEIELKISEDRQKDVRQQLCKIAGGKAVIEEWRNI